MKPLISNKKNTIQDAKLVAEFNNKLNKDDPNFCIEELYLKNSGGYFIYGLGNQNTAWSKVGGEGIKSLTDTEARSWVKQHSHDKSNYTDLWQEAAE